MSTAAPARRPARILRAAARTARGILASLLALLLLAGLPYGLIRYIGWPLPHHLPSLTHLGKQLSAPVLGDQVYLDAIAVVIWLLWLLITISFTAETVALVRGVEMPPIPGMRPAQALAVILLTAIGITALTARLAAPANAASTAAVPVRTSAATAPLEPGSAHADSAGTQIPADTGSSRPSPAHPAEARHTVVAGDNLYDIARADYGNGDDWKILYTLNAGHPQADGEKLTDPDLIRPGWILNTEVQPSTSTRPSTQTSTTPAPGHDRTAAPSPAVEPETPAPDVTPAPAAPVTRPSAPQQSQATRSAVTTRGSAVAPTRQERRPATTAAVTQGWIELAEGGALAAGALAALLLALRRARRRRRWHGTCYWPTSGQHQGEPLTVPVPLRPAPQPLTPHGREEDELDEFGAPSLPASTGKREASSAEFDDAASESTPVTQRVTSNDEDRGTDFSEAGPARITVAAAGDRVLTLQDLPCCIALTGPGALDAARALTASMLSASEHRRDGARLLITRDDAALLLETTAHQLPDNLSDIGDLELFDNAASALAQLEAYAAYRTRLLHEHDAQSLEQILDEDDFPPVVLITVARPETAARTLATLHAATGLRIHAVLLGDHPNTTTWHIEPNGQISAAEMPGDPRAFHLPAPALAAALVLLAQAESEDPAGHGAPLAPDPHGELALPEDASEPCETPTADREPEGALDGNAAEQQGPDFEELVESAPEAGEGVDPLPAPQDAPGKPAEPDVDSAQRTDPGPMLLTSTSPDKVAEILEEYAARPVRIKVLGVRAITTRNGTIDTRLRADAWRIAMKLASTARYGQHLDDLAVLWPDQQEQALRATVKNAVYDLRKTLRQRCGDPAGNPGRYLTQRDHRYAFNEHTVGIDLAAFTALRTLAARTRDIGERREAATAALELYDGDLLAGHDEEWMIAPRIKTRRDALATATLLAQLADRAGEPEAALGWWERALEIDDNEEVYRRIITAQLALGHHADALATCTLLTERLAADDLVPAPETMTLIAQARGRRPTPTATAGTALPRPARAGHQQQHRARPVRTPERT